MTQDTTRKTSLVRKFADKYSVDANKMLNTLTATAFRQRNDQPITSEQMMALLIVADQYHLNPFTKEIYAFPDKGGIVPIIGVDGWSRIINEHSSFDGMHFAPSEDDERVDDHHKRCSASITCTMYRKDRNHPIEVTEYLDEVYRAPFMKSGSPIKGPWQTHTKRFLRHKAMIQCARLAFGFVGIYDQDEAERIVEGQVVSSHRDEPASQPAALPYYEPEEFERSFAKWSDMIQSGKKTPDQIISILSTRSQLSDDQKQSIRDCAAETVEA